MPKLLVLIALFAASARLCAVGADDSQQVEIELRDRRAEIRSELLKYTPLGSSAEQVLQFLNKRLKTENGGKPRIESHPATGPAAEGSDKKGVQSIRLVLGQYLTNPVLLLLDAPLPLETAVSVQWAFDRDGRLIEIFVDKQVSGQ